MVSAVYGLFSLYMWSIQFLLLVLGWFTLGVPHLTEGDQLPVGGKPAWAAPPNPRIGPWFRLLKSIADSQNLTPEFEVTSLFR